MNSCSKVGFCPAVIALSIGAALSASAQTTTTVDAEWDDLRDFWTSSAEQAGVVGSSIMLMQDGEVIKSAVFGMADAATGREVDDRTIYHWASITKTFTGIAIMQLRDEGLLSLNDPIIDYLPELASVHNPFGDMRDIKIHHLMSHSAGFRGPTWPWAGAEWHPHEPTRWAQLVAMFPYTEILFEPGSRYSYSNPGVILLGRVIELLKGEDVEVYIDKNILKPLAMYRTYFDNTPRHLLPFRSNNYFVTDGEVKANGLDFDTGITASNGGLNAPVTDMAKYLSFLSGADYGHAVYEGVLRRESLEEMWEIQQPISSSDGEIWSMGLSFFLRDADEVRIVGHTGGQKGFRSFVYVQPEIKAACLAVFNTIVISRDESGRRVQDDTGFNQLRQRFFEWIFPGLDVSARR